MIELQVLKQLFQEAIQQAEAHHFTRAISVYRKVLSLAGDQDVVAAECAHWGMGELFFTNGDYTEALQSLESAITLNPGEAAYHYLQGIICIRIGAGSRSLSAFGRALYLEPQKPKVLRGYGRALHLFGHREEGLEMLQRALSLKPEDHQSLFDLGLVFASEGRFSEALVCLERALELAPYDPWITVTISTIDRETGITDVRYPIPATGPDLAVPDEEWDDEEGKEDEDTVEIWEDEDMESEGWEDDLIEDDDAEGWEDEEDEEGLIDIH